MLDSYGGKSIREITERSQIVGCRVVSCDMQCIAVAAFFCATVIKLNWTVND